MSEEKIKLLMGLFGTKNLGELEARCPLNIHNWLYNTMDNEEFVYMIMALDKLDDEIRFKELKERGDL